MPTFKDWVAGRTAEGSPADADELYLRDDSGNISKRVTYSGLKTALGSVFATLADPTFTGNVVVPDADAAGEAVNKGQLDLKAPLASPTFTGSVVVPAADAANEAAQVTAIDAATGRLAIGGIEMGDTGWRSLANADLGNPANLTVIIRMRRTGNVVHIRIGLFSTGASWVNNTDADNNAVIPAGFRRPTQIFDTAASHPARNGTTGAIAWATHGAGNGYWRYNVGMSASQGVQPTELTWTTSDAWPATLPGTAV